MKIYSIYKIENIINEKCYIGFSSNIQRRFSDHKSKRTSLKNPIKKYGIENFTFEIIYQSQDCIHTLEIMEPYFIEKYNSYKEGYNRTKGGYGGTGRLLSKAEKENLSKKFSGKGNPNYGKAMSNGQKKKISDALKGKPRNKEAIEKCRKSNLGKKRTKQQCKNISNSLKGRTFSENHKKSISLSNTGKIQSKETITKRIRGLCKYSYLIFYNDNTSEITFNLSKFSKEKKYSSCSLYSIINGNKKTYKNITEIKRFKCQ